MTKLVNEEIDLRGIIGYRRDHSETIELVRQGKVDLDPLISGRIALEDLVEQGFTTSSDHEDTAVKIIVHP